jgi:hypothetical protein
MKINDKDIKVNQRYRYKLGSVGFVGEVIKLQGGPYVSLRIVQDCGYDVVEGSVYNFEDVSDSRYELLQGQNSS